MRSKPVSHKSVRRRSGQGAAEALLCDLAGARFRLLEEPARAIVGCAALLGYRFDIDLLAKCAGVATDYAAEVLRCAEHLDLIVSEPGLPPRYRFRHELTRAAVRRQLGFECQSAFHGMIASALEALQDGAMRTEELAHHWAAAGHSERAALYFERAKQEARHLGLGE
jgi:predicted ATPase